LRDLKRYFDAEPTVLRPRINDEQAKDLLILAEALENAVGKIQEAESRNGFKLERVEAARTQLQSRVLTLRQELSSQSETDLAAVSTRLAMLQTQYQATGQTFASLSRLTLLDFLR
jgi:flagellin-like hook-associated protein FlgL